VPPSVASCLSLLNSPFSCWPSSGSSSTSARKCAWPLLKADAHRHYRPAFKDVQLEKLTDAEQLSNTRRQRISLTRSDRSYSCLRLPSAESSVVSF